MKTKETNLHAVNDRSMMDWLADEEFNTMTGSGSGSGSGCGCGSGSDNWVLDSCYVQAGELCISGGDPIAVGVQVSWTAGDIGGFGGAAITAKVRYTEYRHDLYFDVNVKYVSARWVGKYGIAIEGQYTYHKVNKKNHDEEIITRYGNIIGGGTVPESLRGKNEI